MSNRPNDAEMAAWQSLLMAYSTVVRVLEQEMEQEQGLPLAWYDVLVQLENNGGRLRMHDLADAVLLSRSNITRLVDRMEAAGLTHREPCPEDRRGMYAVMTSDGAASLQKARPGHWRGIVEHFSRHLEPDDVKCLHTALSKVLTNERSPENRSESLV